MDKEIYEIVKEYYTVISSNIILKGRIIKNIKANHYMINVSHYFTLNKMATDFIETEITRKDFDSINIILLEYFEKFTDKYNVKINESYI